ncbi:TetR/AcrR family transcriptional regulator [Actinoallomurus iriomotensis]|uniref:TetR family transcriptional regulator n=1 Tax=Actinoallomurus iriomotensis TaxID=478107 RepID=A0A9W6RFI0_9ACTN|nr:TetR/AcrR family transcriptional regulator [Actinoallomurus iriomotensis]GLY75151.1 TetR family transcriptional regulator [Actinoallomurus iriomotensis]
MSGEERPPRERMVYSAAQLVRSRGVAATGVRDVVAYANAPRGSFQHYFPGGKDQLVGEALAWSADFAARRVASYGRQAGEPSPSGLFAHMARQWREELTARRYERGCPIMATASELAGGDSPVNEPLRTAAARWERAVVEELVRMGVPAERAGGLATVMISALEGAIMLARVCRDVGRLDTVVSELAPVLDSYAG